jgi:hypothetical protein
MIVTAYVHRYNKIGHVRQWLPKWVHARHNVHISPFFHWLAFLVLFAGVVAICV